MEPTTYKHMPNVICPNGNCNSHTLSLVAYAFDNGSAKWSEYRCAECGTHFRVNRQYALTEILFLGKSAAEIKAEILRMAALQSAMEALAKHNAPADAYRALMAR